MTTIRLAVFVVLVWGFVQALPECPDYTPKIIFYADPEDCSRYYECYSGQLSHMNCSQHLYWNSQVDTCDYLANVDCGTRPIPGDVTTSGTTTPTTPSFDPNPQCPASAQNISFYPDPANCKQYFECNRGIRHTIVCPGDLLYNVKEQACDIPELVDCIGRSTNVPTTTEITTISVPPTFDPNPQCPASEKNISFYPDPANCKQYFECNRGTRHTIVCPDDLLFNVKVEACDIPLNVDCSGRSTNVPTTTEITTISVPPTFDPNPQCPASEKNISFYPDPANCKQFFECNRGIRYTIPCPDDLLYNVKEEACDIPTNVDCSGRSTNVPTTTEITTISVPPTFDPNPQCPASEKNISFYPDPANCKQFFECNRGIRYTIPCPDDLLYNVKEEACDIPTNVDCSGRSTNVPTTTEITTISVPPSTPIWTTVTVPPSTVPPTTTEYDPGGDCRDKADGDYVGNPYDCKIFYQCEKGNGTARRCQDSPQDLYWCQSELTCDVKDKPGCVCWGH